ncbi:hypothetical protein NP493_1062g00044 [Ridgeia piscesae]|uniref:Uncharacterized protein n=1 Tax=Ridgeia piscesae TaxID=27915 RepID=A0AAD9NK28_RIDPI|nr:hypothetical protein NP493_1062g00044 [Ridgeia piscesae]
MVIKGDPRKGIKTSKEWITVLLACSAASESSVSPSTIIKCFARCGFMEAATLADEGVAQEHPDCDRLLGDVSWDDYVTMDDATLTTETAGDDWEAAIVAQVRGETQDDDDEVDDSGDGEPETPPVITAREALLQVKNIVGFALGASDAHLLEAASNLLQGHCIRQAALAEQKTITDFFKSQ